MVLCKLVGDKLPKAREEVDPKALLDKDVVVEANCPTTKTMNEPKLAEQKTISHTS